MLVLARGGVYSKGAMRAFDFQEPYLRAVLGFIGFTDVEVVRVEGVAFGEEAVSQTLQLAEARGDSIVHQIAAQVAQDVRAVA